MNNIKFGRIKLLITMWIFLTMGVKFGACSGGQNWCGCQQCPPPGVVTQNPISSNLINYTIPPSGDIITYIPDGNINSCPNGARCAQNGNFNLIIYWLNALNRSTFSSQNIASSPSLTVNGIQWQNIGGNDVAYVVLSGASKDIAYTITIKACTSSGCIMNSTNTMQMAGDVLIYLKVSYADQSLTYPYVYSSSLDPYPVSSTGKYIYVPPHLPFSFLFSEEIWRASAASDPIDIAANIFPIQIPEPCPFNRRKWCDRITTTCTDLGLNMNTDYDITLYSTDAVPTLFPATKDRYGMPLASNSSGPPQTQIYRFLTSNIKINSPSPCAQVTSPNITVNGETNSSQGSSVFMSVNDHLIVHSDVTSSRTFSMQGCLNGVGLNHIIAFLWDGEQDIVDVEYQPSTQNVTGFSNSNATIINELVNNFLCVCGGDHGWNDPYLCGNVKTIEDGIQCPYLGNLSILGSTGFSCAPLFKGIIGGAKCDHEEWNYYGCDVNYNSCTPPLSSNICDICNKTYLGNKTYNGINNGLLVPRSSVIPNCIADKQSIENTPDWAYDFCIYDATIKAATSANIGITMDSSKPLGGKVFINYNIPEIISTDAYVAVYQRVSCLPYVGCSYEKYADANIAFEINGIDLKYYVYPILNQRTNGSYKLDWKVDANSTVANANLFLPYLGIYVPVNGLLENWINGNDKINNAVKDAIGGYLSNVIYNSVLSQNPNNICGACSVNYNTMDDVSISSAYFQSQSQNISNFLVNYYPCMPGQ